MSSCLLAKDDLSGQDFVTKHVMVTTKARQPLSTAWLTKSCSHPILIQSSASARLEALLPTSNRRVLQHICMAYQKANTKKYTYLNFSGAKPDNKKATTEQPDAEKCVDENNVGNCEIRKDEVVSEHLDKGLKFKIAR